MFSCFAVGQLVQKSIHDAGVTRDDTYSVSCAFHAVGQLHGAWQLHNNSAEMQYMWHIMLRWCALPTIKKEYLAIERCSMLPPMNRVDVNIYIYIYVYIYCIVANPNTIVY